MPTFSKYIFRNPIGLFFVLINWGVILISLSNHPNHFMAAMPIDLGFVILREEFWIAINLPAILPVAILFYPLYFFNLTSAFNILLWTVSVLTITFQWFYVGKKISNFIRRDDSESELVKITYNSN